MRSSINVHLHGDTRVSAPDQVDGFLEISGDSDTLNLFLGYDDETRIDNIDKLAEALLDIRTRCLVRMAQPDAIDEAKAAREVATYGGDDRARTWTDAGRRVPNGTSVTMTEGETVEWER